MYSKLPNLVLGFHGCDQSVFESVIYKGEFMKPSENTYDWLGHGIYFWEHNYQRALEWAQQSPKVDHPAVIGAVIDLGYCLNLTDSASTEYLKLGYQLLCAHCRLANIPLPANKKSVTSSDILLRDLDCSVIQELHDYCKAHKQPDFDSVRGIFPEGPPPYPGSAFHEKTHVQLCIVNPNCIKGFFCPLEKQDTYPMP